MVLVKFIRDIQRKIELIPAPAAILYNIFIKRLLSKSETRIALAIIQRIKKGILVDIGSGTGFLSIEIGKRAPHLKIYGVDLSKKMVEIATNNARGLKNVQFKLGSAAELPFEDESIDFITSTGSFHHWKNPVKIFNECYRVLRSNGEGWIYDGCSDLPYEEVNKLIRKWGFITYLIMSRIPKLHGFRWEEYKTSIRNILDHTNFKDNYTMELIEMWMRITLKKKKVS
ncbi:MAG: class I SAM-dependent methyltransferase [Candidatus Hermodarchaeota archaeon]